MSNAAALLHDLETAGVHVDLDHDRLKVTGDRQAIASRLTEIRACKADLLALLQAANEPDGTHQADLDELTEERAALLEFDGGFSRTEAEQIARGVHADYIGHLMKQERDRCGCCTNVGALVARFCPEGLRLRDAYHAAADRRDEA
ncbi:MAG: hypothetical protein K9L82_06435 [Chromatiaceae bacterium]|nr:hypothetical protein [Chromatiaceae bacterium]MCF7993846.1 hypothetical protein [Chromatiaceae bacterium]MCF8003866.1 hypothetical protein [Chromatiaceae bacterium]MCF8017488.1 hypothetical protein [Chromatiaceae bacterium]